VRKTGFGAGATFVGEAECAATQTWQVVDSFGLEWRCTANANADHRVSSSESHAIRFEIDCIREEVPYSDYSERRSDYSGTPVTATKKNNKKIGCRDMQKGSLLLSTLELEGGAMPFCSKRVQASRSCEDELGDLHMARLHPAVCSR
jgi:hypothetical protein